MQFADSTCLLLCFFPFHIIIGGRAKAERRNLYVHSRSAYSLLLFPRHQ